MRKTNKKGFTIVELVIVIAVIGILATVMIPTISGVIADANEVKLDADAKALYSQYISEATDKDATTVELVDNIYIKVVGSDNEPVYYTYDNGELKKVAAPANENNVDVYAADGFNAHDFNEAVAEGAIATGECDTCGKAESAH